MKPRNSNFKVGVFALLAVGLFLAGLITLGARDRFKPRVDFETAFVGDVSGLSVGSLVKFRGVPVGKVTDIKLAWNKYRDTTNDYVLVEFEIDSEYLSPAQRRNPRAAFHKQAEEGLRMQLEGQGITGLSTLKMDMLPPERNAAPPIDWIPDHIHIPSAPSFFGAMLGSIAESLEKIRKIDVQGLETEVRTLLVSLETVAAKLAHVDIESIGSEARDRLVEFKATSESIRLLADDARTAMNGMKLPGVAAGAESAIRELRVVIGRLDQTMATIGGKVGEVEVGPLNESLENIRRASRELEETLRTIRSYPSGAIFGDPPAPARSVAPPNR